MSAVVVCCWTRLIHVLALESGGELYAKRGTICGRTFLDVSLDDMRLFIVLCVVLLRGNTRALRCGASNTNNDNAVKSSERLAVTS